VTTRSRRGAPSITADEPLAANGRTIRVSCVRCYPPLVPRRAFVLALLGPLLGACIGTDDVATTIPFGTSEPLDTGAESIAPSDTTSAEVATSPADSTTADDDPTTTADTTTGLPACPSLPDPAPAWITPLQEDLVARLSGAAALPSGGFLSDRATLQNRSAALAFLQSTWDAEGLATTLQPYSATGTNLYATLPATVDTDLTVVIGAHYDSVPQSPGANDNATGVAMVTSLGRFLQALPCRELHVILVLFDEEEIGLLGSQAFASYLVTQSITVHSVHTIDQMGWDQDGDRAIELERADEGLFELYAAAEPLTPGDTPLVPTDTGFTDHVSFRALGFDAVGLTEEYVSGDTTPHYHLPSDTFDTVDLDYLASSTTLLHATIGSLVSSPAE
jgi:hypothetical protein